MSHEGQSGAETPSVRLDSVTKRFGDFTAVREMELDIPRGQFFTMLGPSGCGKTTTLRMVAGFEEPTEGRAFSRPVSCTSSSASPTRRPISALSTLRRLSPNATLPCTSRWSKSA